VLALGLILEAGCGQKQQAGPPSFVGAKICGECHGKEHALWEKSDHALAMQEANDNTVLGNFDNARFTYFGTTSTFHKKDGKFSVRTDGPDGKLHDYEIAYTFGVYPLQQYLIPFPRGRYQALTIAWDSRPKAEGGQRWFHLYPNEPIRHDDILHWTRPSETWNFMCAECHSTGLKKNYDLATDSYKTTWSEIDVACEACHGPGSSHVNWARTHKNGSYPKGDEKGLTVRPKTREMTEACFRCHARSVVLDNAFVPGAPFLDSYRPSLLTPELYYSDGQIYEEVYEYASFLQSRMYRAGVTCRDCHDPHSLKLRAEGNGACASCHPPAKYDVPAHHHHKAGSKGGRCVACHMPTKNYMVVDPRLDHSIRIPRPDASVALGVPNACNKCHKDKKAEWAAIAVADWLGPGRTMPPHYGSVIDAGRKGTPGMVPGLMGLAADNTQAGIVRATAFQLLREHAAASQLSVFQAALRDPDPLVRGAAVASMEGFQPETRWQFAGHLLSDPVRYVRYQATPVLADVQRSQLSAEQAALLDQSVAEYLASQMVNADMAPYHINIGVMYQRMGKPDRAEAAYGDAIRLDPTFAPAYVNLADMYREQRREDEGERVLRKGMAAAPKAAEIRYALGLILVRQKRPAEALPQLREADTLRPDLARYALAYALALEALGQRAKAMETLIRSYRRHPHDRDLLFTLATFSRDRGKMQDAMRYAKELAAVAPEDRDAKQLLKEMESRAPGNTR
jgi:tetratricopeptide (TPR) repeat protein